MGANNVIKAKVNSVIGLKIFIISRGNNYGDCIRVIVNFALFVKKLRN
jgi:hypothetical protein